MRFFEAYLFFLSLAAGGSATHLRHSEDRELVVVNEETAVISFDWGAKLRACELQLSDSPPPPCEERPETLDLVRSCVYGYRDGYVPNKLTDLYCDLGVAAGTPCLSDDWCGGRLKCSSQEEGPLLGVVTVTKRESTTGFTWPPIPRKVKYYDYKKITLCYDPQNPDPSSDRNAIDVVTQKPTCTSSCKTCYTDNHICSLNMECESENCHKVDDLRSGIGFCGAPEGGAAEGACCTQGQQCADKYCLLDETNVEIFDAVAYGTYKYGAPTGTCKKER